MTLVERAAKRLQEIERAGTDGAPREGSAVDAEHNVSKEAPAPVELSPTSRSRHHDYVEGPVPNRVEPTLTKVYDRAPTPSDGRFANAATDHTARRVELDLSRLATAGYIQPGDPESAIGNEFRKIKRPLIKACKGKLPTPIQDANRIMVTSSREGEGKTFVALNLALSMAMERDSIVLLVDADTTHQTLSRLVGTNSGLGLLDLLADGNAGLSNVLLPTNIERLMFLPAGGRRQHATELLASEAMVRLVTDLTSRYTDRILIFDAPPLLGAPEPSVLASHMGQVIMVVEAERTTRKTLAEALSTIQSCQHIYMVLNKAPKPSVSYGYYG